MTTAIEVFDILRHRDSAMRLEIMRPWYGLWTARILEKMHRDYEEYYLPRNVRYWTFQKGLVMNQKLYHSRAQEEDKTHGTK